jgi:hypothetical protein
MGGFHRPLFPGEISCLICRGSSTRCCSRRLRLLFAVCAELQITQETRADHAQYLAQWLQLMKDDSRAVFAAAAKAPEAASYLKV